MQGLEEELKAAVGQNGLLLGEDTAPYCVDWRGVYRGQARAVIRPSSAQQLAQVVKICAAHGVPIVPQGGNTGLCGGAVPSTTGDQVIVVTSRMNRILEIDPVACSMTVEAGVTLAAVREAAQDAGLMFPLSIGSEGTAQIGGILSTNAGGSGTARYGNARDRVLGLEAVLPDGSTWDGLRKLRKDNSGYCIKHLLMGAEGTLGIITCAVLQLVPAPRSIAAAFCTVASVGAALALQQRLRQETGGELHTFEYMGRTGLELVLAHIADTRMPVALQQHHLLIEVASFGAQDADQALQTLLGSALEEGLLEDAAIARSEADRRAFWKLRESFAEAQVRHGAHVKCDVSVPLSRVADFIEQVDARGRDAFPGSPVVCLSHLGDGNVHCNVHRPADLEPSVFLAQSERISAWVDEIALGMGGSFSAEHGIGSAKVKVLLARKPEAEITLMRLIKSCFDPQNLMNPGKVLDGKV